MDDALRNLLERIDRLLEMHGMSDRNASLEATGKPDFIRDLRRAKGMPAAHRLDALARVLGTTGDWLLHGGDMKPIPDRPPADRVLRQPAPVYRDQRLPRDVPVLGTALAGDYDVNGGQVEMTELMESDVVDHMRRPVALDGVREAYVLTVIGDSMWPRFDPGRRIYVHPRKHPAIGDDVVVQLLGNREDDGDSRIVRVLIKQLVRRTAAFVELRQFNPDLTFRVDVNRIAHIHRVVPPDELLTF